jgi:hypothetical protein
VKKKLSALAIVACLSQPLTAGTHGFWSSSASQDLPASSCLDRLGDVEFSQKISSLRSSLRAVEDLSASANYADAVSKAVASSGLSEVHAQAMIGYTLQRENSGLSPDAACIKAAEIARSGDVAQRLAALANDASFATSVSKARVIAAARREEADGNKFVGILDEPSSRTSSSVTFNFPERSLKPGECLYFVIPSDLSERGVNFAIIGHRQDPDETTGTKPGEKWDAVPGTTSMQIYDPQQSDSWRYWEGPASGARGAKFAEVDHSVEVENLYDWSHYGHSGDKSGQSSSKPLKPHGARMCSNGKDPVKVSQLIVKVDAPKADLEEERVFSEGTSFGIDGRDKTLGGGQAFEGLFPGALALGYSNAHSKQKLPEGWKHQGSTLSVPLKEGMTLSAIELAAGDSHSDKITNSDGGWGTKGWARLSVDVVRADGSRDTLMSSENVPPEGFLVATPESLDRKIQAGDRLVIRSDDDTTYLMGLKTSYIKGR